MKPRTLFTVTPGRAILVLAIILFALFTRNQEPAQFFPATINHDCAPWDGTAFTVSIPMDEGTVIDISIWRSPAIKLPVTFSFSDETGQGGNAIYQSVNDGYETLRGKVFFWRVEEGSQVEGRFELVTEAGRRFEGKFKAEWGNAVTICR